MFPEDEVLDIKPQTYTVETNTGRYLIGPPSHPRSMIALKYEPGSVFTGYSYSISDRYTVTRIKEKVHVVDTNTGRFLVAPPIRPGRM